LSGSCKSSFAVPAFPATEGAVLDAFRGLVATTNAQSVNAAAFAALHAVAAERLKLGRLTVVDATNVPPDSRRPWLTCPRPPRSCGVIVLDVL